MNIDIIKFTNEEVVSYMTTLMSYGNLPYITNPSRITHHSMTCIDHIFIKLSRRKKVLNILSGLFYFEISDHLTCFIFNNNYHQLIRDVVQVKDILQDYLVTKTQLYLFRIWSQKSGMIFTQVMVTTIKIITVVLRICQQSFPVVRVSRKRWKDKPWVKQSLKIYV